MEIFPPKIRAAWRDFPFVKLCDKNLLDANG